MQTGDEVPSPQQQQLTLSCGAGQTESCAVLGLGPDVTGVDTPVLPKVDARLV